MPILNTNGVSRKDAKPIAGTIFGAGIAASQHPVLGIIGTSYSSPFTKSAKSVFPVGSTVSTQPHLAPLKVESPGQVVHLKKFVKVHPNEKGTFFATNQPPRPIVGRVGGPSKHSNTAANPNQPKHVARPFRMGSQTPVVKTTNMSFLRSGGTLGAHAEKNAGTSSNTSRWSTTKTGAAG